MNDIAPVSGPPRGPQFDNRRVLAGLIDVLIVGAVAAVISVAAGGSWSPALSAVVLGWGLFYYFALESGAGQTVGKRALGLRVRMADGSDADMRAIAMRTILRVIDGIGIYLVGLVVMLVSGERRQRLGDMAGGTIITSADYEPTSAPAATTETTPATSSVVLPPIPAEEATLADDASPAPIEEPAPAPALAEQPAPAPASSEEPAPASALAEESVPALASAEQPVSAPAFAEQPAPVAPEVEEFAPTAVAPEESEPVAVEHAPVASPAAAVPELTPFEPFAEPVAEEPAVEVLSGPVADEPVVEEPAVEVLSGPVADEPVVEEPAVEVVSGPAVEEPVVEESVAEESAAAPVVNVEILSGPVAEEEAAGEWNFPAAEQQQPDEEVTVRSVETVSAIDLVMGDAQDGGDGPKPSQ